LISGGKHIRSCVNRPGINAMVEGIWQLAWSPGGVKNRQDTKGFDKSPQKAKNTELWEWLGECIKDYVHFNKKKPVG